MYNRNCCIAGTVIKKKEHLITLFDFSVVFFKNTDRRLFFRTKTNVTLGGIGGSQNFKRKVILHVKNIVTLYSPELLMI